MIPVRTVHKVHISRRQRCVHRRSGRVCIQPRLWLHPIELEAVREMARHFKAEGSKSPLGQAVSALIGLGIDATLEREPKSRYPRTFSGRHLPKELVDEGLTDYRARDLA
jgi:hypothetical protein